MSTNTTNVRDLIDQLHAPRGVSSMIASLMSGDLDPVSGGEDTPGDPALDQAKDKLQEAQEKQQNCGSDYAYWGYEGQIAYWRSVVNLLEAAKVAGSEDLPGHYRVPEFKGVVMDVCAKMETWSQNILDRVKKEVA